MIPAVTGPELISDPENTLGDRELGRDHEGDGEDPPSAAPVTGPNLLHAGESR